MKKTVCSNCGKVVQEDKKPLKAYQNICLECIRTFDDYKKGYEEGYRVARREMKDFLRLSK